MPASKMEEIENDPRFAHTAKDPRFKPNFKQKKVKIDSRFKSMLQDKEFNVKFLDKRGRPINSSTKEDLRRLYQYESEEEKDSGGEEKSEDEEGNNELSSGEEEEDDGEEKGELEGEEEEEEDPEIKGKEGNQEHVETEKPDEDSDESESSADSNDDFPDLTTEDGPDYARGVGILESSDDEQANEEEEEEEEEEKGILDHHWNEPDHDAPEAEEVTSRLALCNMDWDRIKAKDLYVLFNSFVPQGGAVQSVTIYPSELGKEKMAEEEKLGPREFREGKDSSYGKRGKKDDGRMRKLDRAKLRQYQLNRLAYYYAVIVCDSKDTANKIYEECDSMEYEKSACRIDLRFIPEGMTFEETPKDSCTGVSELSTFQPSTFTTTAFCQAKVQVTWDETNIERLNRTMQKKFSEEDLESNKFDEYIASSASEGSSDEEVEDTTKKTKKIKKKEVKNYRKLLGLEGKKSKETKKGDSSASGGESDEEEEEMGLSASVGEESEDEEEEMQFPPSDGGESEEEEEEEQQDDTVSVKSKGKDKTRKKKPDKKNGHAVDASDEEEVEGDMQYTWQPSVNQQALKTQTKKKLTPWEEYQQKKKDKKKQKKRERKLQRLKEQGVEDTTDLGFDDEFFNDEPDEDEAKKKTKKKDKKKKKRQQVEDVEESEADKKEKAALALLMKGGEEERHGHFSLLQIMKEEKEGKRKKGKKRKQTEVEAVDTFEMDLDQSRFGSLYTDPDMHIDPNAPEFKKTKGMTTLMEKVTKKRKTS
ncbi:ESF1 homolog [Babylonia areolata]|uniref:ESF1 homolog n=1 Tax=Babylonia areolata TaxID=304850 RepID=UPI003FD163C8